MTPHPARPCPVRSWLDIATHGLTRDAAARVQAEYLEHYQDAHEAGETDILSTWGDPHAANRALRRAHLTSREAALLPSGYTPGWPGLRAALLEDGGMISGMLLFCVADLFRGKAFDAYPWIVVLGMLLLSALRWRLLSRSLHNAVGRTLLAWTLSPLSLFTLLAGALLVRALVVGGVQPVVTFFQTQGVFAAVMALYLGYHALKLVRAVTAARKLLA